MLVNIRTRALAHSRLPMEDARTDTRIEERRSFLFLTVVMVPVLAVAIVTGYGFAVWMYQLFAGPPGT
jgi:nitrate reductase NapE